jgi:hypothetical protein
MSEREPLKIPEQAHRTHEDTVIAPLYRGRKTLRERLKEKRALERGETLPLEQEIFNADSLNQKEDNSPEGIAKRILNARFSEAMDQLRAGISERERQILDMLEQGLDKDQIAASLGVSPKHYERLHASLRKKAEEDFLEPNGFMRVKPLGATLEQAAFYDRLLHATFMRWNYTTVEATDFYHRTRKGVIPPPLERKGVIPLHANMKPNEYYMLKNNATYSERIIMVNNIACISQSDLDEFRASLNPTSPEEKPLSQLVQSADEKRKIRRAIKRGRIKTNKKKNQHHLTEEDIQKYYASVPDHYKGRNKKKSD